MKPFMRTITCALLAVGCWAAQTSASPSARKITVALAAELDSLDACDTQTSQNGNITRGNVYESLTRVNPDDGKVQPLLAASWKQLDDLVWEFKLRAGVRFHDDTPFDAKVAAMNINRTQPGAEIGGKKVVCLNVDQFPDAVKAEAIDDLTIRITTRQLDPILPLRLSFVDIGNAASQTTSNKTVQPIGTGPFKFVERLQGESVKLTRWAGYWGDQPEVQDVTYVFRAEASVRAGMVLAGEAQLATSISAYDATHDDRTVTYRDNSVAVVRPNTFKEPFIDRRVRQAVSYAIDRETIVPSLMGITGEPWYQMQGPQVNGYIPDFEKHGAMRYDPAKAKALISAAKADGHPVEVEFNLVTQPTLFPNSEEVVQAIAQELKAVGLNPKILSVEGSIWRQYQRPPFPESQRGSLLVISHDNSTGDSSFSFPKYVACKGIASAICSPEIDKLLAAAGQTQGEERAGYYRQAAQLLYTYEAGVIGVAQKVRLMMLDKGIIYHPNSLSGLEIRIADISFKS
ncbi:peptide/nickel transport system substrate-binding protein [Neorhizobium sp. 2083]|uniref:ABC transporter substrate-binding protein n=1 Tax=Neorhizobium sp. 2083 TaxID=2817762 RepID=UPI00286450BD|nr:ABC transporter substrate-binding protein [Neorhizobium sp. 2083]MDR6817430.1 peptide/nickel transport system substrate-binding protein [Neorhizobium sp. 2083]